MFDVWAFLSYFDNAFLLRGVGVTVLLTVFPMLAGLLLGMVLALGRGIKQPDRCTGAAGAYIWVFRGTPLIVQLVIIYTGLPQVGLRFGVVMSAFLGLTLNEAAYLSEIIRSGFAAVPAGQLDAAKALGLRRFQSLRLVMLPQAFRGHPAAAGQFSEQPAEGDGHHLRHFDGGDDAARAGPDAGPV